jgi:hypothetical protein
VSSEARSTCVSACTCPCPLLRRVAFEEDTPLQAGAVTPMEKDKANY